MDSEPHEFSVCSGDLSTYILWCIRCSQPVTLHGSIRETLFHAPAAMLYHWMQLQQAPRELPGSSQRAFSLQANYFSLELLVNVFC